MPLRITGTPHHWRRTGRRPHRPQSTREVACGSPTCSPGNRAADGARKSWDIPARTGSDRERSRNGGRWTVRRRWRSRGTGCCWPFRPTTSQTRGRSPTRISRTLPDRRSCSLRSIPGKRRPPPRPWVSQPWKSLPSRSIPHCFTRSTGRTARPRPSNTTVNGSSCTTASYTSTRTSRFATAAAINRWTRNTSAGETSIASTSLP